MKSCEKNVAYESDYFIYSPSRAAQGMFLYPVQCGLFFYLPGYQLTRESFDSFLLMFIQKGEMDLEFEGHSKKVSAGSFVLLDCRQKHSYSSQTNWECLWCHFDGVPARAYYTAVTARLGNVFTLPDTFPVLNRLTSILRSFYHGSTVKEPLMNKYLVDIFTEFLMAAPENPRAFNYADMAEKAITYINEHFAKDIPLQQLSQQAGLSQYHFIRIFKKETGFTPHEYLINTRMTTARYLLKNTQLSVKDICFTVGFSSESVFCNAFKKHHGMTPAQYRLQGAMPSPEALF